MLFTAKCWEPSLKGVLFKVERDDTIDDRARVVAFFVDWLQTFAQGSLVGWRDNILDVIERCVWLAYFLNVYSTAISSTLNFSCWAVEPDNSIKTAFNQHLGRHFFGSWLDQKEGIWHLLVSLSGSELFSWLVTAQSFLKKFRLSVVAGEINKDPSNWFGAPQLIKLLTKTLLLGLECFDLFFLYIFGFEFVLNATEAFLNLDLTPSLVFDFFLLCLGIFVWVLHAKLGNKDLDIKIIRDFLPIKK